MARAPKTGRAAALRAWMQTRPRPFSPALACDGAGIMDPAERQRARDDIRDFVKRGEVVHLGVGRYAYNPKWQRASRAELLPRIYKAMYVSGRFAASDVQRLVDGSPSRNYLQKILRRLSCAGHIRRIGVLPSGGGAKERLWAVVNRERFRKELL